MDLPEYFMLRKPEYFMLRKLAIRSKIFEEHMPRNWGIYLMAFPIHGVHACSILSAVVLACSYF